MIQTNPEQSEEQQLFDQLTEWADLSQDATWQRISAQPELRAKIVESIKEIAALPIAQAEGGASPQFVVKGKHVFNLRPLVVPTVVSILVNAVVFFVPPLGSPLLLVMDAVHFAEKAREVYAKLTEDESDVYGAVTDLYTKSKRHSVTNTNEHPTADGVRAWFADKHYQLPENIDGVLQALVQKGALRKMEGQTFYEPTFLGRSKKHE